MRAMAMVAQLGRGGALALAALMLASPQRAAETLSAPTGPSIVQQAATDLGARRVMAERITAAVADFDGVVGVAVEEVATGWTFSIRGDEAMPQQSVSKLWVSLAVLAAVDRGELSLDERVTIRKDDLSLFHQPIRKFVGEAGYSASLRSLMDWAMRQSDNAANDALVRRLGGPFAVQVAIVGRNIDGVRFGPGERAMQTGAAGLEWRPEFSFERHFWEAREALPQDVRRAALEAYVRDPPDGATPLGVCRGLARLYRGELLSPNSTSLLLGLMSASWTGAGRLKSGLPPGWRLAHKTGTGQVMGSLNTGYNDVGLIIAPDGRVWAVAVMIASTREPLGRRQALMGQVARAVAGAPDPVVPPPAQSDEEAGVSG
jgi:beta-lactamase class A